MLSFHSHLKIYLAVEPADMRKSYNGLYALATEKLEEDPKAGGLFIFSNRRHNRLKILYFDRTGVCVLAKRLEKGTFQWPRSATGDSPKIVLSPAALQLLIDGVDLRDGMRRAWYEDG